MKNKQQPKQQKEPLYKFKSAIYPRTFWVYFGNNAEFIAKTFEPNCEMTEAAQIAEMTDALSSPGSTTNVYEEADLWRGILLCFPLTEEREFRDNLRSFVHESGHACDLLFQELGITKQDFDEGNEAYTYLLEWVFDNIYESYLKYKETYENNRK